RERDLRHDRALRERGSPHEVTDRHAVAREPRRPVRKMALVLLLANGQTEIRPVIAAVLALAALRREERDDMVARRDIRHAVAYDLDDACAFVPEHCRRIAGGVGARSGVE